MRYLAILLIGLSTILGTSCNDDDEVPVCIDNLVETLRPEFCEGADLTLWEFNGREVYCFLYGTCEESKVEIYEEDCTLVCELFGADQNILCEGIPWDGNASRIKTIYTF